MITDHLNKPLFGENETILAIADAIQPEIDNMHADLYRIFQDAIPATATITGIVKWEQVFAITPDPATEDIDFRRARIINRLSQTTPFTERTLIELFDRLIGVGNYSYVLSPVNGTLDILSLRPGKLWVKEIKENLKSILPANIAWTITLYTASWNAAADYNTWQGLSDAFATWQTAAEEA